MTNKIQIIDKVLHRLYESNGNQIEIDTLLIQLKSYDNIVLTEQEFVEITHTLKAENLCEILFINSLSVIKLTQNAFSIIHKHKSYSNYLFILNKEKETQYKKERFLKRVYVWTLIFTIIGILVSIALSICNK